VLLVGGIVDGAAKSVEQAAINLRSLQLALPVNFGMMLVEIWWVSCGWAVASFLVRPAFSASQKPSSNRRKGKISPVSFQNLHV